MATCELVIWGVEDGVRTRNRDPVTVELEQLPTVGEKIDAGELPALNGLDDRQVRFPLTVTEITASELDRCDSAVHVEESRTGLAGPKSANPQFNE